MSTYRSVVIGLVWTLVINRVERTWFQLRDSQGFDLLDLMCNFLGRIPKIYSTLRVEPELGRVAK